MNPSLIAILSIFIGIIGANLSPILFSKKMFGFAGNTIVGVFGSVFFTKILGRFGLNPKFIFKEGILHYDLLFFNFIISFIGALLFVFLLKRILQKINASNV